MVVERERERQQEENGRVGEGGGRGGGLKGGMFFAQALHINTLHHLDLGGTDLVSHVERESG